MRSCGWAIKAARPRSRAKSAGEANGSSDPFLKVDIGDDNVDLFGADSSTPSIGASPCARRASNSRERRGLVMPARVPLSACGGKMVGDDALGL